MTLHHNICQFLAGFLSMRIEKKVKISYNIRIYLNPMTSNSHHEGKNSGYFKIHVHPHAQSQHKTEHKREAPTAHHAKNEEKRSIKGIFSDALRQIVASAIFLVIGVVLLNWSAYSQIAKHKIEELLGTRDESPLNVLVETDTETTTQTQSVLEASNDLSIQKKQIPEINLEVAPSDNRIIIPRIDKNIPIVRISSENLIRRDWNALETEMQDALQDGVVHYPGTSLPGQSGNVAITGHSSYFPWDDGRFKDVFALLHDLVEGDKILVYWDQKKYVYQVTEIKVVLPEDIEILKQTPDDRLTLITCTPVGTNLKRLIIIAEPVETETEKIER